MKFIIYVFAIFALFCSSTIYGNELDHEPPFTVKKLANKFGNHMVYVARCLGQMMSHACADEMMKCPIDANTKLCLGRAICNGVPASVCVNHFWPN